MPPRTQAILFSTLYGARISFDHSRMNDDFATEIQNIELEIARGNQQQQEQQQQQQQAVQSRFMFAAPAPSSAVPSSLAAPFHPPPTTGMDGIFSQGVMANGALVTPGSSTAGPPLHQPQPGQGQPAAGQPGATGLGYPQHTFSKDSDERSIFVGNLPKNVPVTAEDLIQFFSRCGPILNCTVLKDRVTNEPKGTAYIEFSSYASMGNAIDHMNNAKVLLFAV
eukprot:gene7990-5550_t